MAQRAGRITCSRCGANNFDTVTSCWKCGAPVGVGAVAAPIPMSAPQPANPPIQAQYNQPGMQSQPQYGSERAPAPVMGQVQFGPSAPLTGQFHPSAPAPTGDPAMARRAAVALGITLPFLGLPVGWIFMMIEDRNKQAVGRLCATWSLLGLVLHLGLTWFMFQQTLPMLKMVTTMVSGALGPKNAGSDGTPQIP